MKPLATGSSIFKCKADKSGILPEIEKHFELCKPIVDDKAAYRIDWKIVYGKLFGK